jgi:tetratricopeptide (TPR) repeat protein
MHTSDGARLTRALHLLSQGRFDLAEPEAMAAIAEDPREARAHAALALCLSERKRHTDAVATARQAVSLDPGEPWNHLVLADVLINRNSFEDGLESARGAIALSPEDPHAHTCEARALVLLKRYRESLQASERALALDPENTDAGNIRAAALQGLGRGKDAAGQIDTLLAADPNSAITHTNKGWALLSSGHAKAAGSHFREALRFEPSNDSARQGLIESIRARSPFYTIILRYFLFMSRLPARTQWMVLIGGYVLYQVCRSLKSSYPTYSTLLNVPIVLYLAFAAMSVLSRPLHSLLLFLHPLGRHALTRGERLRSAVFAVALALPLIFLTLFFAKVAQDFSIGAALFSGLLVIPVALATEAREGSPRIVMSCIAGGLAVLGTLLLMLLTLFPDTFRWLQLLFVPYAFSCVASVWVSNFMAIRPADVQR